MAAIYTILLTAAVVISGCHGSSSNNIVVASSSPPMSNLHLDATRNLNNSDDKAVISVPISPFTISLSLFAANGDTGDNVASVSSWSRNDLEIVAIAAEEYLERNDVLELSLNLNKDGELELEYDGVDFKALSPEDGQRRAQRSLLRSAASVVGVRRSEGETTMNVLLEGSVKFSAAREIDPLDSGIPTEDDLSQLVRELFVDGEQPGGQGNSFISAIESVALREGSSSSWLAQLKGYNTLADDGSSQENGDLSSNVSKVQTNAGVNQIKNETDSDNSSNINLFIIIGAAGAGASLVLLLGGLCYAKRKSGSKGNMKSNSQFQETQDHQSSGNNKLESPKKQNNSGMGQVPPPPPLPMDNDDQMSEEDDDDESNADFLLARQALDNPSRTRGGASVVSNTNTFADDMSYAFSVDADSIAAATKATMDDVIGNASFQNEKGGVFQWNEEGTKMVYIPANDQDMKNQNGFVYDEEKKKWVVEEKNVSFDPTTSNATTSDGTYSTAMTPPRRIQRSRTDDTGTQSHMTGITEFSYDDVALDFARRAQTGDERGNAASPNSPGLEEEGVEVMAPSSFRGNDDEGDGEEFVSNTDVDGFMRDDDSTAFGSVLTGSTGFSSTMGAPHPVTPERAENAVSPSVLSVSQFFAGIFFLTSLLFFFIHNTGSCWKF